MQESAAGGGGAYALQPIQNAAKTSRFVADALLIGDRRPYPVLLVVPNFDSLQTWARRHEVPGTIEQLVANPRVRERIRRDVEAR
jgi:long-chain acyl-CoA synthetase